MEKISEENSCCCEKKHCCEDADVPEAGAEITFLDEDGAVLDAAGNLSLEIIA